MRVMLDTNVLISMLLFPSEKFKRMLDAITGRHKLVLSSFVVEEMFAVVERHNMKADIFQIRDVNDYPVLYTAIIENIDIFITGDKDFQDVDIEKPEIMTPMEFLERL